MYDWVKINYSLGIPLEKNEGKSALLVMSLTRPAGITRKVISDESATLIYP